MGLDVSHDCFSGAYSAFNRFRQSVARACGGSFPPHEPGATDEDGTPFDQSQWYYQKSVVPEEYRAGMTLFLGHSDCDGTFTPAEAEAVAGFLEWFAPRMTEDATGHLGRFGFMSDVAWHFADGCRRAAAAGETVEFY